MLPTHPPHPNTAKESQTPQKRKRDSQESRKDVTHPTHPNTAKESQTPQKRKQDSQESRKDVTHPTHPNTAKESQTPQKRKQDNQESRKDVTHPPHKKGGPNPPTTKEALRLPKPKADTDGNSAAVGVQRRKVFFVLQATKNQKQWPASPIGVSVAHTLINQYFEKTLSHVHQPSQCLSRNACGVSLVSLSCVSCAWGHPHRHVPQPPNYIP